MSGLPDLPLLALWPLPQKEMRVSGWSAAVLGAGLFPPPLLLGQVLHAPSNEEGKGRTCRFLQDKHCPRVLPASLVPSVVST